MQRSHMEVAPDIAPDTLGMCLERGLDQLSRSDAELHRLCVLEHQRQRETLSLLASSSIADPSVLACQAMAITNVTTEGYPGARYHSGCELADQIERLAVERSKRAFGAQYANVQPHSGTGANQIVLFSLLNAGDILLGMGLDSGGHLTHGARQSWSGQSFTSISYGVDADGFIDYDAVEQLAIRHRPKLIISGASAYPRAIDFGRFRQIADRVGALLLADISHIAGLVASGHHESPIDTAHVVTSSTYKQLCGPRGGLILLGKDHLHRSGRGEETLATAIRRGAFPGFQGTPNLAAITAKARALQRVDSVEFREVCGRIVANARMFAECLMEHGYKVVTGGTDNHMVLISLLDRDMTGRVAEAVLEECGILVNKNVIHGERRSPLICSGVRFGTNTVTLRGMGTAEMRRCAQLVHRALSTTDVLGDTAYSPDAGARAEVRAEVRELCREFPIAGYGAS